MSKKNRYIYKDFYHWIVTMILRFLSLLYSKKLIIQEQRVLVISPHPDDEILGCAGLLQKLVRQGKDVKVIILTRGESVHEKPMIEISEIIAKRRELTLQAAQIVGLTSDHYVFLDWGDGKLHETQYNESRKNEFMSIVEVFNPEIIFIPHIHDNSIDHIHAAKFILQSLKNHHVNIRILHYCVWLWYCSYKLIFKLYRKRSYFLRMSHQERLLKKKAIDAYVEPKDLFGMPYSGDLEILPSICKWKNELFFEVEKNI